MAVLLFCFYKAKAPQGCPTRGEEIRCFATPLAREEFARELFNVIGKTILYIPS